MEVGKTYRLNNNVSIAEQYRNKEFTITKIDDDRVYIVIEGVTKNFKIEKWQNFVGKGEKQTWAGSKLLFKFIWYIK